MSLQFHKRKSTVAVIAVGALVTFGKNAVAGLVYLYQFALTPQGNAVMQVGVFVGVLTILAVSVLRR